MIARIAFLILYPFLVAWYIVTIPLAIILYIFGWTLGFSFTINRV